MDLVLQRSQPSHISIYMFLSTYIPSRIVSKLSQMYIINIETGLLLQFHFTQDRKLHQPIFRYNKPVKFTFSDNHGTLNKKQKGCCEYICLSTYNYFLTRLQQSQLGKPCLYFKKRIVGCRTKYRILNCKPKGRNKTVLYVDEFITSRNIMQ